MIRDVFIKDLGWKLFSLFLAVMIWVTVHKILPGSRAEEDAIGPRNVTYDNLPVDIVSEKADVHEFRASPQTVKVTASGPPEIMAQLKASQIHAAVNLTDVTITRDLHCPVDVSAPPRITLTQVTPAQVVILPPASH